MNQHLSDGSAVVWQRQIEGGVPVDAPCVDGHFPGKPIVPGAILVGYAAKLLAEHGYELWMVRRLKFLQPLSPGRSFTVQASPGTDRAEIVWLDGDTVIARCNVEIRALDV